MNYLDEMYDNSIAIIGMSGRFPKCRNLEEYWNLISSGEEAVTFFSDDELREMGISEEDIQDPNYVKAASMLEDYDKFDADFFDINPREAEVMDPQQRIFLQTCYEALESAGYTSSKYDGKIGVFGGASMNSFLIHNLRYNKEMLESNKALEHVFVHGNMTDYLCTRVSYKMNLTGPSVALQSACSTSATAVYMACQSLLNYESDMVLAGGVSVKVPQREGYRTVDGGIFSPSGHCRAFDDACDGTIFGSGVGVVVLKRLKDAIEDHDSIVAIIRGAGINNDGNDKVGYTAPSVNGQRDAILQAIEFSEVDPDEIGYVETHGTGTKLGDLIEMEAIDSAYKNYTQRTGYCAIGSVKSNIGHLNAASGIASIIKTALVLKHGMLPPSINCTTPNKKIPFQKTPFYVNTELKEWNTESEQKYAGVSSFGIGGTNIHLIMENYIAPEPENAVNQEEMVMLSAKTQSSMDGQMENLIQYLSEQNENVDLHDLAYTLRKGREEFSYRVGISTDSISDLRKQLEVCLGNGKASKVLKEPKVAFLFSGQGTQYANATKDLYETSTYYREYVDKMMDMLQPMVPYDVKECMFPKNSSEEEAQERMKSTEIVQPTLFIWEYCLAKYLMHMGIKPDYLLGHSLGEFTAACIGEVFTEEDALKILVERGKLAKESKEGRMLSVSLDPESAKKYTSSNISLSVINKANMCVLSGTPEDIEKLQETLDADKVSYRKLINTRAFHSHLLEFAYEPFETLMNAMNLNKPCIPIISNTSGEIAVDEEITSGAYWAKHLCRPVNFAKCTQTLVKEENLAVIEVGPGKTLLGLVRDALSKSQKAIQIVHSYGREQDDYKVMLGAFGEMWQCGLAPDWDAVLEDASSKVEGKRIPLPTYAFSCESFCLGENVRKQKEEKEEKKQDETVNAKYKRREMSTVYAPAENEIQEECVRIWEEILGITGIGIDDDFFELGGHSLIATQIIAQIQDLYGISVPFSELGENPTIRQLSDVLIGILLEDMEE